jgi:hypothetical protein
VPQRGLPLSHQEALELATAGRTEAKAIRCRDARPHAVRPVCETELEYVGTKRFHEGTTGWGFALGDLGGLFVNRESFDVYVCGRCGRVELFVDGTGEEFRPH